jgi:hypothetical protein
MKIHLLLSTGVEGCGKILHHFIPLSHESLLEQQINMILFSIIFVFFQHGGFVGGVRDILHNIEKINTQLAILGPHRGHALKNQSREACSDTIDPYYFIEQNEGGDIKMKYKEILQDTQKYFSKYKNTIIHNFY